MKLRTAGMVGILSLIGCVSERPTSKSNDFQHDSFVERPSLEGMCKSPILLKFPSNEELASILYRNRDVIYVDKSSIKKVYILEEGESFIGLDYYPCGFVIFTNKGAHYFTQR